MATTIELGVQERAARTPQPGRKVNDFSIQVATVNGSGSQSANTVLLRSIFQMGVPVSGKNLFPSNIAGLAYVVHHPRQQARLHCAEKGNRFSGGHERRDGAGRRDVASGWRCLRLR